MPIDALSVLCAQLTRDLLAIAKFLFLMTLSEPQHSSASNKCIGDDTKAAVRQSLNCIKNKKYGEKRFSIWRNCYTLQCGTIMTLISPGDCTLQCAMWHVALELWQWIHQVAAFCNVIRGSGMKCHWIRRNVRHIGILHLLSISTTSPPYEKVISKRDMFISVLSYVSVDGCAI